MNNFWNGLGYFFIWLGFCFGIGGCIYLSDKNTAEVRIVEEQTKQLNIQLELERVRNSNKD